VGGTGVARTESFTASVFAWRAILRGEGEDFGPCGASTLDERCADFVARLLPAPARVDILRRDLRARGVAAFGLLLHAA
jgi:hypothetical protein